MAAVYYKNRQEAGQKAAQSLINDFKGLSTVISLTTDAVLVAAQIAAAFKSPLQLYLNRDIEVPGNLSIGNVDQYGQMNYRSDMGAGFSDYFYQEFRSYIEQETRESFSELNREIGSKEVLRKDLIKNRDVYLVSDCLESVSAIDSFLASIKSVTINRLIVCSPICLSNSISDIQRLSNGYYVDGVIDFFYGPDHYFEDNSIIERDEVIEKVSSALKLWP